MTTCPHCQTALDGVGESPASVAENADAVRYVLCPDCHNLVAGGS